MQNIQHLLYVGFQVFVTVQAHQHGDVDRLFATPQQAYTRELIAAIPQVSPRLAQAHTENA